MKKLNAILSLICLLLVWRTSPARAQSGRPITEHGLEQSLRLGGLKEAELIGAIDRRGVDFLLTGELERQLTGAGASEAVLHAVRTHYRGPDSTVVTGPPARSAVAPAPATVASSSVTAAPAHSSLPQANGIYVQRTTGSAWASLHGESAEYTSEKVSKVFGKASGGLLKLHGDVNGEIAGEHSNTSVQSPATFLIRMPGGMSATDYLLVHTHLKHDNREFKISAESLKSRDSVDFRVLSVSGSGLQIEVSQGAGDYAFVDTRTQPGTMEDGAKLTLYTFQIVP